MSVGPADVGAYRLLVAVNLEPFAVGRVESFCIVLRAKDRWKWSFNRRRRGIKLAGYSSSAFIRCRTRERCVALRKSAANVAPPGMACRAMPDLVKSPDGMLVAGGQNQILSDNVLDWNLSIPLPSRTKSMVRATATMSRLGIILVSGYESGFVIGFQIEDAA